MRIGDAETGKIETFPVDIEQFSIGQKQLDIKMIYANDLSGQFAVGLKYRLWLSDCCGSLR